ncbi:MAG: HPF/RaiA family ribosome-associated protein [Polyangiaceae bacterium]
MLARSLQPLCFMQTPVQITFRGMSPSEAIEAIIRQRVEWLEGFNNHITRCHVVVDVPHRQHPKGRAYSIRIDLGTPSGEIVASSREGDAHEDIHTAIRHVFDAARRQVEDEQRLRRVS